MRIRKCHHAFHPASFVSSHPTGQILMARAVYKIKWPLKEPPFDPQAEDTCSCQKHSFITFLCSSAAPIHGRKAEVSLDQDTGYSAKNEDTRMHKTTCSTDWNSWKGQKALVSCWGLRKVIPAIRHCQKCGSDLGTWQAFLESKHAGSDVYVAKQAFLPCWQILRMRENSALELLGDTSNTIWSTCRGVHIFKCWEYLLNMTFLIFILYSRMVHLKFSNIWGDSNN